jgi:hypothetical protein
LQVAAEETLIWQVVVTAEAEALVAIVILLLTQLALQQVTQSP